MNRRNMDLGDESEEEEGSDEDDDDEDDSDASSMGGIQLGGPKPGEQPQPQDPDEGEERDPYGLPPSDDEEEMAELRRRVLASKPFANPSKSTADDERKAPEKVQRPAGQTLPVDSDAESGSDIGDDDEFDSIMNAAPVTDRAGITATQRKKAMEKEGKLSATFSRNVLTAPGKWPP